MPFMDMITEMRGSVAALPIGLAKKLVNRAYDDVKRRDLWSFQLYESQWITPVVLTGTCAVVLGSTQVVLNTASAAALNASLVAYSLITQRQFRCGGGGVYNIIGWDGVNTITLDRYYGEVTNSAASSNIYQCYYAAPFRDHRMFITARDMRSMVFMDVYCNREYLDRVDLQRTRFLFPSKIAFYQNDQNRDSATYKSKLFEIWGHPLQNLNFQLYGIRSGAQLVSNADVLPDCIGEDLIIAKAKYYAYEWAEANKAQVERNQGPDYKFLMGAAKAEYSGLLHDYRKDDRNIVNNWISARNLSSINFLGHYNSLVGTANAGF